MANYTQNYITAEEFTTLQNHDKMYQGFIEGVGYAISIILSLHLFIYMAMGLLMSRQAWICLFKVLPK